jgi:hypothetical protein
MARTVDTIFNEMKSYAVQLATDAGNADALAMFNNTSRVAIWRLFFYTMSYVAWTLEAAHNSFVTLINNLLANQTAHTLKWYRTKALSFQFGFPLIIDTDKFDNTGFSESEIEASKVIKYAAVNASIVDGKKVLLMKIATLVNGELTQLPALQETAFKTYMEDHAKDAGVDIIYYNRLADLLRSEIDFYYDPLLLDGIGNRLDGLGVNPVEQAANNYLQNLSFNGEFSNAAFIDALQLAYGASEKNVFLKKMERKTGASDFISVNNTFIPEAGYVKFETNGLLINYISHVSN